MSESENIKNVRDDEIDLLDLFKRMGKGLGKMFRTLGRWLLISIVFLLRNWLPLLASVIIGVGASYLLKFTSASFYTSDMVLRTNAIQAGDMIPYINRLHIYCKEKNQAALSEAVSLNNDQIKNIIDINAYWIIDKNADGTPDMVDLRESHDVYDTINIRMNDRLNVRVKIIQPQELHNLRDGLLMYIDKDSLFQQRNRVRLRQINEMVARLDYDILQLDSLQKIKYFEETKRLNQTGNSPILLMQEQKTQLVYSDIHGLFERKQNLDSELSLYNDLATILSDFSIPAQRQNGGMYYGKVVIPSVFVLTLIILIILHNRKKLKDIFEKY